MPKQGNALKYLVNQLQAAWEDANRVAEMNIRMRTAIQDQSKEIAQLKAEVDRLEALQRVEPDKPKPVRKAKGRRLKVNNKYKVNPTKVRAYMKEHNMKVTDLAALCEVKPQTIYSWLAHRTRPTMEKIKVMADYFEVDISVLVAKERSKRSK